MWILWALIDTSGRIRGRAEDRAADEEALARAGRGEANALAELYDRHARPVYSLALRILGDTADAEDAVQETFSQAWRQSKRYDPRRGTVAAWLLTIARTRAIDRLRARQARPDGTPTEWDPTSIVDTGAPAPELQLASAERTARVRAVLNELPFLQRVAIELAYYEGLTHTEIAERLEQPLGTVKTRIRLGLIKMREALTGIV
jgi:RNA polymerase sigma-70 factor (ECF subfamily)